MRNYIILISALCAVLFGTFKGCQAWESSLNKKLLQGHVTALFKNNGVRGIRIDCKMVRNTKVGYCQLRLSSQEVGSLVTNLKLSKFDWEVIARRGEAEIQKWDAEGGCREVVETAMRHKYDIYVSKKNAEELELPNGLQLTYMLIYHHPVRGDGCVQASYEE